MPKIYVIIINYTNFTSHFFATCVHQEQALDKDIQLIYNIANYFTNSIRMIRGPNTLQNLSDRRIPAMAEVLLDRLAWYLTFLIYGEQGLGSKDVQERVREAIGKGKTDYNNTKIGGLLPHNNKDNPSMINYVILPTLLGVVREGNYDDSPQNAQKKEDVLGIQAIYVDDPASFSPLDLIGDLGYLLAFLPQLIEPKIQQMIRAQSRSRLNLAER